MQIHLQRVDRPRRGERGETRENFRSGEDYRRTILSMKGRSKVVEPSSSRSNVQKITAPLLDQRGGILLVID